MKDQQRSWHHRIMQQTHEMNEIEIIALYVLSRFLVWHRRQIRKWKIIGRTPYHWPERQKFKFILWRRRFHIWVSVEVLPPTKTTSTT